ncbi:hypothetical protein L4J22_19200 [Morganella morganii]|uniref:hypothetical protein n=1 Tax=Morganella morganii TaxID=582 RepID=UPI0022473437|nr:hypothetical protein [Morganella morganii]MCW9737943.1 hypothetical protein [Morganella morganii]
MSTNNISYNQLLIELEKRLIFLRDENYTENQRIIMKAAVIEFFHQLTDYKAIKDVMDLEDRLNNK